MPAGYGIKGKAEVNAIKCVVFSAPVRLDLDEKELLK